MPVQQAGASTGQQTVNVKTTVNVREQPSPKAKIIGSLKNGQIVFVYSTEPGGWSKIKFNNKAAYVASSYLRASSGDAQSEITIPDQALREVILEELGKSGNKITKADMEKIVELNFMETGVENLKGLEYAKNLTTLTLTYSSVINYAGAGDLGPIKRSPKLKNLYMEDMRISKKTGSTIAEMKNLQILGFSLSTIEDISFVYKLPQLKKLYLSGTNLKKETINQIKKRKPNLIIEY